MIESGIQPKSPDAVKKWIWKGGKLKVGGDVLVGFKRWHSLFPKPAEVAKLLANMQEELDTALASTSQLVTDADIGTGKWTPDWTKAEWTPAQVHTALGYQKTGFDFVGKQKEGKELTPLLRAPHVLHRRPGTVPAGTNFSRGGEHRAELVCQVFGKAPHGDVTLGFLHEGTPIEVRAKDPHAVEVAEAGTQAKADPSNSNHVPCQVPGEMITYLVQPGDEL